MSCEEIWYMMGWNLDVMEVVVNKGVVGDGVYLIIGLIGGEVVFLKKYC